MKGWAALLETKMDEDKFKEMFAATFLATWCATQYDHACAMGQAAKLEEPPVEDAIYLADTAWAELQKVMPNR